MPLGADPGASAADGHRAAVSTIATTAADGGVADQGEAFTGSGWIGIAGAGAGAGAALTAAAADRLSQDPVGKLAKEQALMHPSGAEHFAVGEAQGATITAAATATTDAAPCGQLTTTGHGEGAGLAGAAVAPLSTNGLGEKSCREHPSGGDRSLPCAGKGEVATITTVAAAPADTPREIDRAGEFLNQCNPVLVEVNRLKNLFHQSAFGLRGGIRQVQAHFQASCHRCSAAAATAADGLRQDPGRPDVEVGCGVSACADASIAEGDGHRATGAASTSKASYGQPCRPCPLAREGTGELGGIAASTTTTTDALGLKPRRETPQGGEQVVVPLKDERQVATIASSTATAAQGQ